MANPRGSKTKVGQDKSKNVADLPHAWADERKAVEYLERQRWGDSPACPRCGDTDVYQMRDEATGERSKRWLWRCRGCNQQYTVRVGTIMEDSAIPLPHWCFAFAAGCASKKGISALQIHRMTGVSYKSALFMMHRIRWAMGAGNGGGGKLDGIVEVDETYVGGKKRKGQRRVGRPSPKDKAPVVALVERGGRVRVSAVANVTAKTLRDVVRENVATQARVMTDEFNCYARLPRDGYMHETVCHSAGEYARGDVHTNTVEGFFAIVKRGLYGTFHAVSRKHLHRYLGEFEFRYNTRWFDDGERMRLAIQAADGRRLTYQQQLAG
jgi:transposase-like protein